jgi:hypothetical protein
LIFISFHSKFNCFVLAAILADEMGLGKTIQVLPLLGMFERLVNYFEEYTLIKMVLTFDRQSHFWLSLIT